jgi:hypothetical protein
MEMKQMTELPAFVTQLNSKLFQCSEVQWIFSQCRYSLDLFFASFICIKAKERRSNTTIHNKKQQLSKANSRRRDAINE